MPNDSDILDAALRSLDAIADGFASSRRRDNPPTVNRWLSQCEHEIRRVTRDLRALRPADLDRRLQAMAGGFFG